MKRWYQKSVYETFPTIIDRWPRSFVYVFVFGVLLAAIIVALVVGGLFGPYGMVLIGGSWFLYCLVAAIRDDMREQREGKKRP